MTKKESGFIVSGVFAPLMGILRFGDVSTDNNIFKLHYRVTVVLLSVFTLMISSKQFFGEPIHCIGDDDKHKDATNSYCWLYGTYTVQKHLKGVLGTNMAHIGVGPHVPGEGGELNHQYYQWVCIILPLQAFLFYLPHALWKVFEGGRIKGLTDGLNSPAMPTEWDEERRLRLIKHLIDTNLFTRNFFAYQFFLCEMLNFGNVILQIFFLDKFLAGMFTGYGATVIAYYRNPLDTSIVNPMEHIFPKVTKCLFKIYGSSGSIQTRDLMCILPLNIINEKVFIFMWFWLIFLAVISGLALIYRFFALTSPCLRAYIIMTQAKLVPKYHIYQIIAKFRAGDWFVLHLIGKNVNCFVFKDVITLLGQELEKTNNKKDCDII